MWPPHMCYGASGVVTTHRGMWLSHERATLMHTKRTWNIPSQSTGTRPPGARSWAWSRRLEHSHRSLSALTSRVDSARSLQSKLDQILGPPSPQGLDNWGGAQLKIENQNDGPS